MAAYVPWRNLGLLLLFGVLFLGLPSCSRQRVKAEMAPEDRLALADQLRQDDDCARAIAEYEKLLSEFPTPQVAEAARFNVAVCHVALKQYDLARTEFEDFIDTYPKSDRADNALYMIARTYMLAAPRAERDQTETVNALDELLLLLREYPDTDMRNEAEEAIAACKSKLAKKEYLAAELYFRMRDYDAAMVYLDSVLESYGDTPWAPRALLLKGRAYSAEKRFEEAETAFQRLLQEFPDSGAAADAAGRLKNLQNVRPGEEERGSGG